MYVLCGRLPEITVPSRLGAPSASENSRPSNLKICSGLLIYVFALMNFDKAACGMIERA